MSFKALLATQKDGGFSVNLAQLDDEESMDCGVTVDVEYSTVNYKDGLALTNRHPNHRAFPPDSGCGSCRTGSDIRPSRHPAGRQGQTHHGDFTQKARVPRERVVKLIGTLSNRDAMTISTAGSIAIAQLSKLGYRVGAQTCQPWPPWSQEAPREPIRSTSPDRDNPRPSSLQQFSDRE